MKWEVRTMRSGTSFFDLTIYKKTVNRFWPLWAVNLVFWMFVIPIRGLMDLDYQRQYSFARNIGGMFHDGGVIFALLFSLLVAMAVCSHLYNARSANFFGALPCRREGQFLSTYAAGLTILIGPNLLIFVLTLPQLAMGTATLILPLLFWFGTMCAAELFFFSFAVCIGQFAGHILALPVFYGVFNAIVVALYALLEWVLNAYYFGYAGITGFWPALVKWFTPVVSFFEVDCRMVVYNKDGISVSNVDMAMSDFMRLVKVEPEGLWICGIYAIVGLVLAACALLLYRRRHLETAGDVVAVKAMRPVFQYGVAACTGLFFGFLMEQMFGLTEFGMALWMIIWGVIGYFVARMLLDKSIRVFKKWKGAVAVVVAFLLLFAVIGFDLTGYETRVPDPEDVASVQFSGLQGSPSDNGYSLSQVVLDDPAHIALVTDLHQAIVDAGEDGADKRYEEWGFTSFNVAYTMRDGSRLVRRYSVNMDTETLAIAQQIRDLPEVRRQAYRLDELEEQLASGGKLESAQLWTYEGEKTEFVFSDKTAERLWEAVMTDYEQGLIGNHTVGSHEEKREYRVEFRFRVPAGKILATPVGGNEVVGEPYEPHETENWHVVYREFVVQEESVHTLQVLKELMEPDNRYQEDPSLEDIMAGNARG